jgi:hypothetical protein
MIQFDYKRIHYSYYIYFAIIFYYYLSNCILYVPVDYIIVMENIFGRYKLLNSGIHFVMPFYWKLTELNKKGLVYSNNNNNISIKCKLTGKYSHMELDLCYKIKNNKHVINYLPDIKRVIKNKIESPNLMQIKQFDDPRNLQLIFDWISTRIEDGIHVVKISNCVLYEPKYMSS